MRLTKINEGLLGQKIAEIQRHTPLFRRPELQKMPLYDAERGMDADSRATSDKSGKQGIPYKNRHRQYFGVSIGPENISVQ
jgi:hypothetical protein